MNRSISTQSAVQSVNYALNEVASNLAAHANATLSRAHGLNLVKLPNGTLDQYGNDISKYADAAGNTIGDYYLELYYQNVIYYAPANGSSLPGQPASDGVGVYDGGSAADSSSSDGALVTQIEGEALASLKGVNDGVLVPHTQKGLADTHGSVSVIPTPVFDASGIRIGDYSAIVSYGGQQFAIPCSNRLGGVVNAPRFTGFVPNTYRVDSPAGGGPPYNYSTSPTAVGGTKPFTYKYAYLQGSVWTDFPAATVTQVPFVNHSGFVTASYNADTGVILFISGAPGGDDYAVVRVRCTVTGPGGSTHVDTNGNDLIFEFQVQDHAPCLWLFTEAYLGQPLPAYVRLARDRYRTPAMREGYWYTSALLVPWMKRSAVVRAAVMLAIVNPMSAHAAWMYGQNNYGLLFWPITWFWLLLWKLLGTVGAALRGNTPLYTSPTPL